MRRRRGPSDPPQLPTGKKGKAGGGAGDSTRLLKQMQKAVEKGDMDGVRKGLNDGVSPDVLLAEGRTSALGLAAQEGHLEIVRLLIDRGANVDLACGPQGVGTPLMQACQSAGTGSGTSVRLQVV